MINRLKLSIMSLIATMLSAPVVASDTTSAGNALIIENVTVISMAENSEPLPNQTVVIEDDRIISIAPSADGAGPFDARRIDGRGQYLIPGLSDMHVHIGNDRLLRLVTRAPDARGWRGHYAGLFYALHRQWRAADI